MILSIIIPAISVAFVVGVRTVSIQINANVSVLVYAISQNTVSRDRRRGIASNATVTAKGNSVASAIPSPANEVVRALNPNATGWIAQVDRTGLISPDKITLHYVVIGLTSIPIPQCDPTSGHHISFS